MMSFQASTGFGNFCELRAPRSWSPHSQTFIKVLWVPSIHCSGSFDSLSSPVDSK